MKKRNMISIQNLQHHVPLPRSCMKLPTFLLMRSFCSFESSLVLLSYDINNIYHKLRNENLLLSLSSERFAFVQQQIVSSLYVLSPLRVKFMKSINSS